MWPVPLVQVLYHILNWFFLAKPGFLELIWIFSNRNLLKINISHTLNPNLSKYFFIKSSPQDLSNDTKGTFQFLRNFQPWFNLIFSKKIIQYSRTFAPQVQTSWNWAHAHLLLESFPKTPRNHLKHPGLVDLITTKQNKLPSFIGRLCFNTYLAHVDGTSPKEILRLWQPQPKNKSFVVLHGLLHDHVKRRKF